MEFIFYTGFIYFLWYISEKLDRIHREIKYQRSSKEGES